MTVSLPRNALATVEPSAATSAQQMGIALLLDLAKQGEIDPWDVQVIDAIDRFLIQTMPVSDAAQIEREAALSQSGQAFLCASMLVLLKADSLLRSPEPEEEEADFIEDELGLDGEMASGRGAPVHLERQLRRRAVAQPPQKRRVSLQELLEQLQLMAKAMEESPRRIRHRLASSKSRAQTAKAIAHLAHQENLSETAASLERFLAARWHQIAREQEWIELDQLLSLLPGAALPENSDLTEAIADDSESAPKPNDRVGVFWALLLLSAQSKVELSQEEFYQDLKIRALPEGLQLPAV